jgi:hypothetical protein
VACVARHEEKVGPDDESVSDKEWWAVEASRVHQIRTDLRQCNLPFNFTRTVTTRACETEQREQNRRSCDNTT